MDGHWAAVRIFQYTIFSQSKCQYTTFSQYGYSSTQYSVSQNTSAQHSVRTDIPVHNIQSVKMPVHNIQSVQIFQYTMFSQYRTSRLLWLAGLKCVAANGVAHYAKTAVLDYVEEGGERVNGTARHDMARLHTAQDDTTRRDFPPYLRKKGMCGGRKEGRDT
jgi:hypothetical protein